MSFDDRDGVLRGIDINAIMQSSLSLAEIYAKVRKMNLLDRLYKLRDEEYASFQAKLTPSVDSSLFIGVRVPVLRAFAKEYMNEEESKVFLDTLPHKYYDENMLHGLLISEIKDYDKVVQLLDEFLPCVDNWAVCDIMSPKILRKQPSELLGKIKEWISSGHCYTIRFGIEMLMSFYLDKNFSKEYLEWVVIDNEEYYVKMMVAWFYATSLCKQWEATIVYIEEGRLDRWTHNKAIQKAIDSYRITDEQKKYLRTLRR